MADKPNCIDLENKIKELEREALDYMRKEIKFNEERKLAEYGHWKRAISLVKINEELNREIGELVRNEKEKFERVSERLSGRIKELNCLYDISSFRTGNDFSLDSILQEMIDFIPPACQYPELTCARLLFDGYAFKTSNFLDTQWKQSFSISVDHKPIGSLDVCRLEKIAEIGPELFIEEEKRLISAVAESIARVVEREWAEAEIRRCRNKIEKLIKQTQ